MDITNQRMSSARNQGPGRFATTRDLLIAAFWINLPLRVILLALAELPADRLSVGGAVNNTFRQVGSVLGIAGTMVLASLTGLRQLNTSAALSR